MTERHDPPGHHPDHHPDHHPAHRHPGGAGHRGAVVRALDAEWLLLVDGSGPTVADWSARHPALSGCLTLADVLARTRSGDAVLHALLAEARAGSSLAGRTVLQALLGRVVQLAGRDPSATVDDYVGALWCVLSRYPLERRPARIAANLALDTLKSVHTARWSARGRVQVVPAGDDIGPLADSWWQRERLDHGADGEEPGAAAIIRAGCRLRLIDDRTGELLRRVYVEGLSGAEAAAASGTTAGSLRVRCSRAVGRLAARADDLREAA